MEKEGGDRNEKLEGINRTAGIEGDLRGAKPREPHEIFTKDIFAV